MLFSVCYFRYAIFGMLFSNMLYSSRFRICWESEFVHQAGPGERGIIATELKAYSSSSLLANLIFIGNPTFGDPASLLEPRLGKQH